MLEVKQLSDEFSRLIREALTSEELEKVNEANRVETNPLICHSHTFIDANECMLDALDRFGIELDAESQEQADLTNSAWDLSKKNGF